MSKLHADDCDLVRLDIDGHVVTVTIDRPDARNALNAQVRTELKQVVDRMDQWKEANPPIGAACSFEGSRPAELVKLSDP